jgi:hypothetical protein
MMKKGIIILSAIIGLLLLMVLAVPIIFKSDIEKALLEKANSSMNATLSYSGFQLSLIKSFPDFSATFHNVSVIGKKPFENDTLLSIFEISALIDLPSILKKKGFIIETVFVDRLNLRLLVNSHGDANWDIAKTSGKTGSGVSGKPMRLVMNKIDIRQMNLVYDDREGNMNFSFFNADAKVSGELEGMMTGLDIQLSTPSVNFDYDSVKYINMAKISLQTRLLADLDKYEFTFNTNQSKLNNLPLSVTGGFSMPSDSMLFNIQFEIPDMTMKQVFTMVPDEYNSYIKDVQASGNVSFLGKIEGVYYKEIKPLIDIRFNLKNGVLKYPGLTDELKIIDASALIFKPEGSMDLLMLGIGKLQIQLAGNPLNMRATFKSVMTDPNIDINMNGTVDLGKLTTIFPVDSMILRGLVTANAAFKGNMSDIEANNFEKFVSTGTLKFNDFYFQNNSLPQGVNIRRGVVELKNQDLKIAGMAGNVGKTDFVFDANLSNIFNYFYANGELNGNFNLASNKIDANEFMVNKEDEVVKGGTGSKNSTAPNGEKKPLVFPSKTDLVFQATIKQLLYDKMDITNFNGKMELKNQILTLNGMGMNMLDGTLNMNGSVTADGRPNPDIDLRLDAKGFDLPSAYRDLSIVKQYLPFAKKTEGELSTSFKIQSKLGAKLKMLLTSISANGSLSTNNVKFVDSEAFNSLKSVIQPSKLKNTQLENFTVDFEIKDGNLNMKPFKTALGGQPISISGIYNLGGNLDYRIDATVNREILSNEIQSLISYVPGHESITKIDVGVNVTGDIKKPNVKFDSDKIRKQVVDQIKKSSPKEILDAAKKMFDKFLK